MISNLITKYLNGNATETEIVKIFDWIEASEENKKQFIALKKTWVMSQKSDSYKKAVWNQLQKSIGSNNNSKGLKKVFKYAAILIPFIAISSVVWFSNKEQIKPTNEVVLEIEDKNTSIKLNTEKQNIKNISGHIIAEQSANEIIYKTEVTTKPITFHTLNIPYGKTFKVTLSDGSRVTLNAGTTLRYPKQFSANGNRQVFLEGEAFFEIKKDSEHPFIVNINDVDIKVLGTTFNVNAYSENSSIACVLVEGSVKISETKNNSNHKLLKPNHKASWNSISKEFNLMQVNTKLYTSWIYGELNFESAHFSDISKKLERTFNMKIKNNNTFLEAQEFTGAISTKNSNIENILDLLSIDTPFQYVKNDNVITISSNN